MSRVAVNGTSYSLPFAKLLRALTGDEYAALEADVRANGVMVAVVVATTPLLGRIVVEGGHRALIAERHGLTVPVKDLGGVSDDFARDRCLALNEKRRHLSPAEIAEARREQEKLVPKLRAQGMSQRAIADATGLSAATVNRRLAAGVSTETPDPAEESDLDADEESDSDLDGEDTDLYEPQPAPRVVGADGKSYPASRPAPLDAAAPAPAAHVVADRLTDEDRDELREDVAREDAEKAAKALAAFRAAADRLLAGAWGAKFKRALKANDVATAGKGDWPAADGLAASLAKVLLSKAESEAA